MDGHVVLEEKKDVTVPPLSAAPYIEIPLETVIGKEPDLSKLVLAVDFKAGAETLSENLVYLVPTKQVHLLPTTIETTLTRSRDGYKLTLSSKVLARDVYLTFGNLDVKPSDNYFDLLPNETRQITLKSSATQEQLQQALKVMSLVDAFDGKAKAAQAGVQ